MATMLRCQVFEDSKREKTEPKVSKCQHVSIHDNEKEQCLHEYEDKGEGEDIGYVLFPFVIFPPPQKNSNRLTDIGEKRRSLNQLVCMSKISLSYNC